jgi:hypothetical protein
VKPGRREWLDLVTMAVSTVGGWLLVRKSEGLVGGAAVGSSIVALARAFLGQIGRNRIWFLVALFVAIASYAVLLRVLFVRLEN